MMTIQNAPQKTTRKSSRQKLFTSAVVLSVTALAAVTAFVPAAAYGSTPVGVIADDATPTTLQYPQTGRVELGLTFSPTTAGTLSGVQFYQNAANSGVTSAAVWSSTGALLTRVAVDPVAPVGWRTIPVGVDLDAGQNYTVSVFDTDAKFPATANSYTRATTVNGISIPANAGVYRDSSTSAFPTTSGRGYGFLVDVVFSPTTVAAPPANIPQGDDTVYGPDGTHWPQNTPRAEEARRVDVAPTWSAIAAAITANAASSDPVVICVAPGAIPGGTGANSTAKGVLQNIGNAGRASRILVSACDGVGTVSVAPGSGISFVGVKGVSFIGIDFAAQSVMIRNSESVAIGFTKIPLILVTANGGNGVRDVEFVEVVAGPEAKTGVTFDRVQVKSADGYNIDGVHFIGFYAAPNYKPNGSSSHIDTVQFVTTSGKGTIGNVVFEDSVVFQSSDQGVISGDTRGGTFINSAFYGGSTGQLRYPMYPGGDPITLANMLHGTWAAVGVTDTIIAGTIASGYTFSEVEDSASTAGARGFARLGQLSLADIDRTAPLPTDTRLASIWE